MKRFALTGLILFVIVFAAFPAFAQEATPEPTAAVEVLPTATAEATEVTAGAAPTEESTAAPVETTTTEAEPEGVQGASLAVLLIGGAAVLGVLGFVMLRDGVLSGRKQ